MVLSPMTVTILIMSVLGAGWLAVRERVARLDLQQVYHVASYEQDQRKARFYFRTVWAGLFAGAVSVVALNLFASLPFHPSQTHNVLIGASYGLGLWGLLVIGLVWTQVGKRVSQPNSDGRSPLRQSEEKKQGDGRSR